MISPVYKQPLNEANFGHVLVDTIRVGPSIRTVRVKPVPQFTATRNVVSICTHNKNYAIQASLLNISV